jgi:hypothetical protein
VDIAKAFSRYAPILEAVHSDFGVEKFEGLVEGLAHREAMARVSIEIPHPAERVWEALDEVSARYGLPDPVFIDQTSYSIVTPRVRAAYLPGGIYELYVQDAAVLVPTPYGTTVLHSGEIRWETTSADGGSPRLQLRPKEDSYRYNLVGVAIAIEESDLEVPLSSYPERVLELRRSYELAQIAPADLRLTAKLDDRASLLPNGALDPGETSFLRVTARNLGTGRAVDVRVSVATEAQGIEVNPVEVGEVVAGGSREVALELRPGLGIEPGTAKLTLQALEGRGYHSKALEVTVPVARLVAPTLTIRQVEVDDRPASGGDGDGRPGTGETVVVRARIENAGPGAALGVDVRLRSDTTGLRLDETPVHFAMVPAFDSAVGEFELSLPVQLDRPSLDLEIIASDTRGSALGEATWRGSFPVDARAPLVEVTHRVFDGNSPRSIGDRNGIASNGERLEIELQALNRGAYAAEELTLEIGPALPGIEVHPRTVRLGSLPAASEAAPHRVVLEIPRGLDAAGVVLVHVRARCTGFPETLETVEIPFRFHRPDLRLGPTEALTLVPGEPEERSLSLANLGSLDARDVRLVIRSVGQGVDVLGPEGTPSESPAIPVQDIPASSTVQEVPLVLLARRGAERREDALEVTIEQADFPPQTRRIPVTIAEEAPERVRLEPTAPLVALRGRAPEANPPDRSPPNVWFYEPLDVGEDDSPSDLPVRVYEPSLRLRGLAQDGAGVHQVLVNSEPAELRPDGEFSSWVRLAPGSNLIVVKATDVHGNTAYRSVEVELAAPSARSGARADQAVIFATSRYDRWGELVNPVQDGEMLKALLESLYGFDVELVVDPSLAEILQTLRRYAATTPSPQDQLLVFFAGHGHYDQEFQEGFVVARDSLKDDALGRTYLPHSRLAAILDNLPYRHVLVVLDVCFGGTFARRLGESRMRGVEMYEEVPRQEFIRRQLEPMSRIYLTSGGKEYVHDGQPGRHSPFARRLIEALRSGGGADRILTVGELHGYLEKLRPEPRAGSFGSDEPGGGFLFVQPER